MEETSTDILDDAYDLEEESKQYMCWISGQIMHDPWGFTGCDSEHLFQKQEIQNINQCPVCHSRYNDSDKRPNKRMKSLITRYKKRLEKNEQKLLGKGNLSENFQKKMRQFLHGKGHSAKKVIGYAYQAVKKGQTTWGQVFIRQAIDLFLLSLSSNKVQQKEALKYGNQLFQESIAQSIPRKAEQEEL